MQPVVREEVESEDESAGCDDDEDDDEDDSADDGSDDDEQDAERGGKASSKGTKRRARASGRAPANVDSIDPDDFPEGTSTVMVRNIPCAADEEEVRAALVAVGFGDKYTYFHLPQKKTSRKKAQNIGYAFVGFEDLSLVKPFAKAILAYKFPGRVSPKVVAVAPAHIQGGPDPRALNKPPKKEKEKDKDKEKEKDEEQEKADDEPERAPERPPRAPDNQVPSAPDNEVPGEKRPWSRKEHGGRPSKRKRMAMKEAAAAEASALALPRLGLFAPLTAAELSALDARGSTIPSWLR